MVTTKKNLKGNLLPMDSAPESAARHYMYVCMHVCMYNAGMQYYDL
jgi:hypothetical protein